MKKRGRPGKGTGHVAGVDASADARERLRLILLVLADELSVQAACSRLGVGRTRFAQLRSTALQAAAQSLEPRAPGRPRTHSEIDPEHGWGERVRELETQLLVAQLQVELQRPEPAARARAKISGRGAGAERKQRRKAKKASRRATRRVR